MDIFYFSLSNLLVGFIAVCYSNEDGFVVFVLCMQQSFHDQSSFVAELVTLQDVLVQEVKT